MSPARWPRRVSVVWSACRVDAAIFSLPPWPWWRGGYRGSRGGGATAAMPDEPRESDERQPQYLPPTNGLAPSRSPHPPPYPLPLRLHRLRPSPTRPLSTAVTPCAASESSSSKTLADQLRSCLSPLSLSRRVVAIASLPLLPLCPRSRLGSVQFLGCCPRRRACAVTALCSLFCRRLLFLPLLSTSLPPPPRKRR